MDTRDGSDDLARALRLAWGIQERTSTRIEPFRWGSALYRDDLPQRYYSNLVRVEQPLRGVEVEELARATDRALDGLGHRQIQVEDEDDGARIALGLAERGYTADHSALLALRREPDRAGDPELVDEVSYDEARPFLAEVYRRELKGNDAAFVEPFADFRRVVQEAANGRFFAQRLEGHMAGLCELYLVDGVAQVEHVDTLEEFRRRGVARNVVLRAVHEARGAAADLVVIRADLQHWPIQLYRRLGFDEIGRTWAFTRPPA
ncbi:MAG: GNAT family N-acetyltransferase [Actinobacteria bacterium]|nr:GNAT family N-acetyltransferase [Actinomycetota bacterium]